MSSQRLSDASAETDARADRVTVERDDAFHILSNSRRRAVMRYLIDAEGPVELGDLAEHVAALENDCAAEDLSSDDRKRVYISLYQGHMPKLDEHGIVEYDQARGTVEPTRLVEAFVPYLDESPLAVDDAPSDSPGEALSDSPGDAPDSGFATTLSALFGR